MKTEEEILAKIMLPKFFILDKFQAYTSNSKPNITHFEAIINFDKQKSISVVSVQPIKFPHTFTTSLKKSNFSVYKSNLQKCVRRRLTDRAIRTAYAMMSVDTPSFLRRLPIIMLEDVLPHLSLIPLVWWMMASTKGYVLEDEEISYILGVVYRLCEIDTYQVYNSFCKCKNTKLSWGQLSPEKRDLIWAMEFRRFYRGMYCDVCMIQYLQKIWIKRFEGKEEENNWEHLYTPIDFIDLTDIGKWCDKSDIILEAIDQHCFKFIPKKLQKSFPQYTEYQIKGAIWFYRSRLNVRKLCLGSEPIKYAEDLEPIYLDIKEKLEGLCSWIFNKII